MKRAYVRRVINMYEQLERDFGLEAAAHAASGRTHNNSVEAALHHHHPHASISLAAPKSLAVPGAPLVPSPSSNAHLNNSASTDSLPY